MDAQQKDLTGEYYLRGVMETASGFKLDADSTFQFFFSYGALDRSGQGTWAVKDGNIIFNSRPHPGKDFKMISSKKISGDFVTIKIIADNSIFISHVYCMLSTGEKITDQSSNKEGLIHFPKQPVNSISLIFEFCAERTSVFTINDPTANYFEFGFEPWMMEVFFKDHKLTIGKNELLGAHPLLTGSGYHFEKNK